jgi:AcrR family transcriptional regulator
MNDAATRSRLLREARHLFALRGFRGASVRDITGAARANLGAITYHFGSKQALYDAVVDSVFADIVGRIEAAAAAPGSGAERIRAAVRALFSVFEETPEAPLLVIHQIAAGAGLPPVVEPYIRRNLAAIGRIVNEGHARGEFRRVDPTMVAFTIVSQTIWFTVVGRELVRSLGLVTDPEAVAARMERHVVDIVTRYLEEG